MLVKLADDHQIYFKRARMAELIATHKTRSLRSSGSVQMPQPDQKICLSDEMDIWSSGDEALDSGNESEASKARRNKRGKRNAARAAAGLEAV